MDKKIISKTICTNKTAAMLLAFIIIFTTVFSSCPAVNVNAAKKLSLNNKKVTISVGSKKTLKVKNAPKKAKITYTSNKKKIASVSKKGVVKGKKPGKAKITVTIKYKSGKKNVKRKLTCNITVKKKKTVKDNTKQTVNDNTKNETDNNTANNNNSDAANGQNAGDNNNSDIANGQDTANNSSDINAKEDDDDILKNGYPINEYERGIYYGFSNKVLTGEKVSKSTITWREFCDILGNMIKLFDADALAEWENLTKDAPNVKMNRDGAAIALLYAAEIMGINYVNANWNEYNDYDIWANSSLDYPVFDWEAPLDYQIDITYDGEESYRRLNASFLYISRRRSCVTKCTLLEPDDSGDWRFNEPLTYKDAIVAAVRLYESNDDIAYNTACNLLKDVLKTDEAKAILSLADKRRNEILNSPTKLVKSDTFIQGQTYTGTAYYVSNNGDDSNDGLSEATPWQSLERISSADLQYGDVIFFERGSVWHNAVSQRFDMVEGITLSAYGEGDKPKFCGSFGNSAGEDNWELFFEGDDGRKIWRFCREMPDTGVVVLDGGKAWAKRATPFWDGSEYYPFEKNGMLSETPFDVKKDLKDMEVFPHLRYPDEPYNSNCMFEKSVDDNGNVEYVTGDLYFRCDKGNPGVIYDDIQISEPYSFIGGLQDYTTIDNLSFVYSLQTIAGGATPEHAGSHLIMQNCDCAWMGGGAYSYTFDPAPTVSCMGGAFNLNGTDESIISCYAHHCYQEGPTFEAFTMNNGMLENITVKGNLTEYCMMGNLITNWDDEIREDHIFSNLSYSDNMVLFSGFENLYTVVPTISKSGTSQATRGGVICCDACCFGLLSSPTGLNAHDGRFSISNNVFAFSPGKIIEISNYTDEYSKVFSGNTYVQLPGFGWLTAYHQGDERPRELDPEAAVDKIGDTSAVIVRFDD